MSDKYIFAYGFMRIMVYVHQDGRKFYLTLSSVNEFGLTPTKRPILWVTYPGRGNVRTARRWFKAHSARHKLEIVFDR